MNRSIAIAALSLSLLSLVPLLGRADDSLSTDRLKMLEEHGFFPPAFKAAVHDFVDTQHNLAQVTADKAQLEKALPDLKAQEAQTAAKTVALRQELAKYDHPEENDFNTLQAKMKDPSTKPEDEVALAQAYVWTYPTSPHEGEAQQYLQQIQKQIADETQAEKDAEAAREAAHAKLVQRAQAKDLSLTEWRDFLRDMSQEDLIKIIGRPTSQSADYWIYSGDWTTNDTTHQKVGLQINFNAGRVLTVDPTPSSPPAQQ